MKENVIKLHDKKFKVMIPAAKIEEAVAAVAAKINEDYRKFPCLTKKIKLTLVS